MDSSVCCSRGAGVSYGQASANYQTVKDVPYRQGDDLTEYMRQRCHLDVYHPTDVKGFATVVWFHGGGLTSGGRYIPAALKGKKIAVVVVDYRLYPRVKAPAYIEDAAAAVAWTFKNIERYGGDPDRIFVSGHTITHFTVRKERGIDGKQPIIDDLAPLYHVPADAPPLLLITG